jgi:hypothetical protein
MNIEKTFTCCLCGKEVQEWPNNPWPIKKRGQCCKACDWAKVVPARMAQHLQGKGKHKQTK